MCNFCRQSCQGSGTGPVEPPLDAAGIARENAAGAVIQANCTTGCHANGSGGLVITNGTWKSDLVDLISGQESSLLLVERGNAANSYVMRKVDSPTDPLANGTRRMPHSRPQLSSGDRDALRIWIDNLPDLMTCTVCATASCEKDYLPDGNAAFAYLVANSIVNKTWTETMGSSLTIANYFPRTPAQRNALWNLTESVFVPGGFSLQALLKRILDSDQFNRLPPAVSVGPSAYELPVLFDPWSLADPRVPPVALPGTPPGSGLAPSPDPAYDPDAEANRPGHYNGLGDNVHRYSARSLLVSVHKALGWPAPRRGASATYPSDDLRKAIGEFYRDSEPGFREVDFQGLLHWESVHGQCTKPAGVATDWIDTLVADAVAANTPPMPPSSPPPPVLVRDLALAIKDRLISDTSIGTTAPVGETATEEAAVQALFGSPCTDPIDLSTPAAVTAAKDKARRYCGVLLETPHFQLAGIAPRGLGERPRLASCLPGEPCSYRNVCDSLSSPMFRLGYVLRCFDDSLGVSPVPWLAPFDEWCPRGGAGWCLTLPEELEGCLFGSSSRLPSARRHRAIRAAPASTAVAVLCRRCGMVSPSPGRRAGRVESRG